MQTVQTSLAVINETDVRGEALLALIRKYITFAGSYYGFRSLGANPDIRFPALFVEPKAQSVQMNTTGKYVIRITYAIYWYVIDNKAEDVVRYSSFIGEALIKLFSNNALGDLSTAFTNQFATYSGFWLYAEPKEISWSVNYLEADPSSNAARYMRSGRMLLEIMDEILK